MTGVAYEITEEGIGRTIASLTGLASPAVQLKIAGSVAALVESATRRRIDAEKRAPDGSPWATWSRKYGATRRPGQTILQSQGDLLDSIVSRAGLSEAAVGSNLVYAAIHQFGGAGVGKPGLPARPYLGLADGEMDEIARTITDVYGQALT